MNRQSFLRRLSLGTGATILLPATGIFQSCSHTPVIRTALGTADIPLLDAIAETILPETDTSPGAKAAGVGAYMALMYSDCMATEEQSLLVQGVNEIDARATAIFSEPFMDLAPADRLDLLEALQEEALAYKEEQEALEEPLPHFFDLIKGLVISGYFTSEPGMTQARSYLPVPGAYHGCIPYGSDDKPWAT